MRTRARGLAAGLLLCGGTLLGTPVASAASAPNPPAVPRPVPAAPTVQMFDCQGTTGRMGCGPGWFWRDGWRGYACYPC